MTKKEKEKNKNKKKAEKVEEKKQKRRNVQVFRFRINMGGASQSHRTIIWAGLRLRFTWRVCFFVAASPRTTR